MRRAGFTLVEVLVVVAIVAVMMGTLIPRLPDVGASKLNASSRKMGGIVSYMYDRAAAMQLTLRLTLEVGPEKNGYTVWLLNGEGEFEPTTLAFAKEGRLPDGIYVADVRTLTQGPVADGPAHIHFFPGGYVERTIIHLADAAGEQTTLVVSPITGKVAVKAGRLEAPDDRG
jgi:prepilin-type N-terminal cleavage/methylation domain-containing protein